MDRREFMTRKEALNTRRAALAAELAGAEGARRRALRLEMARLYEDMTDLQDAMRRSAEPKRKNAPPPAPPLPPEEIQRGASPPPKKREQEWEGPISLEEIGRVYRRNADLLRHRIHEVEETRARTPKERREKEERLRLLTAMQKDTRDMAVICERYYEPGYRICDKYHI